MSDTKKQGETHKAAAKAAEVLAFFESVASVKTENMKLANLALIGQVMAANSLHILTEICALLDASPDSVQMYVEGIPSSRAVIASDLKPWMDRIEQALTIELVHDDTGRGDFEKKPAARGKKKAS